MMKFRSSRRLIDAWMSMKASMKRRRSQAPSFRPLESLEPRNLLSATVTTPIDDIGLLINAGPTVITLDQHFDDPDFTGTLVGFQTDIGSYLLHLFDEETPITVDNFLSYVGDNDYIGSFFHRTATFDGVSTSIVQGGGFTIDGFTLNLVPTDAPIVNEFSAERPNVRGTIAMAKTSNPDSATSQFFFNTVDNPALDSPANAGGFTVFGEVVAGMEVIDAIGALPRFNINEIFGLNPQGPLAEVPLRDIQNNTLEGEANFVVIRENIVLPELTFNVLNDNTDMVTAEVINGELQLTYAEGVAGTANITVQATDLFGGTAEQTFAITVTEVNEPPVTVDDAFTVHQGVATELDVLANDTDINNNIDPTTVTIVTGPEQGEVTVDPTTGLVTYTPPDATFLGQVTFTYTVSDTEGEISNEATVTVDVELAPNVPPVGEDDDAETRSGQSVEIDVLANDFDTDGEIDISTVTVVNVPANGVAIVDEATGVITYTPNTGFVGQDTFTYIMADDEGDVSQPATVTVTVKALPISEDDVVFVAQDESIEIDVLANDSDPGGEIDPTTVTVIDGPANGQVSVDPETGVVTYTPDEGFLGVDTFTYTFTSDDGTVSGPAGVTVTVSMPAVAVPDEARVLAGQSVVIDVLANDTSEFGEIDPATLVIGAQPSNGTVSVDSTTGLVTYTPDDGFLGQDTFTYTVAGSEPATVTVSTLDGFIIDNDEVRSVTYTAPDGTDITIDVRNGQAQLIFDSTEPLTFENNRGRITVTSGPTSLLDLHVTDAADNTQIRINTRGGENQATIGSISTVDGIARIQGRTTNILDGVTINGSVQRIQLNDISGDIAITGSVQRIQLNDVTGGGSLIIGGDPDNDRVQIIVNDIVGGWSILSDSGVQRLRAESWTADADMPEVIGSLTAPYVNQLQLRGDLEADLLLNAGGDSDITALNRVQVRGSILGGTWQIVGDVGQVATTDVTGDFTVAIDGSWRGLNAKGDVVANFAAVFIQRFTVRGAASVNIDADGMQNLVVREGLTDSVISLGGAFEDGLVALRQINIRGVMDNSQIISVNSLGNIRAVAMLDSTIFAGIGDIGQQALPDAPADYAHAASIGNININGQVEDGPNFFRSNIAAWSMRNVNLSEVDIDNDGSPFGIAADTINRVNATLNGERLRLNRLDDPQALADELADLDIDLGDFRIELV